MNDQNKQHRSLRASETTLREQTTPNLLFNEVALRMGARNDSHLAAKLEITASMISRIRNKHTGISAGMLVLLHTESGLSIAELKRLANLKGKV